MYMRYQAIRPTRALLLLARWRVIVNIAGETYDEGSFFQKLPSCALSSLEQA